jgi:cation diffusion facilitator family transporter
METKINLVQNADKLAGITTIVLIFLGIIQIILGETVSKSIALTANGIDCIGDGFVSAVVWGGLKFFRRPADQKFHYGYYKMENLASIIAAFVMMILALYIIYRSYDQLINPHPVEMPLLGAFVAMVAAIIAIALGFYKYFKGKKSKFSSVKLDAVNTVKDGVASGLAVLALIFSSYGFYIADAIVGFIISGVIVSIGFAAIKESSYMLIDACDGECLMKGGGLKEIAENFDLVKSAQIVRLRRSGPVLQGELEIIVPSEMTVSKLNSLKKQIRREIKEKYPDIERLTISAISSDDESK